MNIYKFSFIHECQFDEDIAKLTFMVKMDDCDEDHIKYVLSGSNSTGPSATSTLVRHFLNYVSNLSNNYYRDLVLKIYDSNNNLRFKVCNFYKYDNKFEYMIFKRR